MSRRAGWRSLALGFGLALLATGASGLTAGEQSAADAIANRRAAMNQLAADVALAAEAVPASTDGAVSDAMTSAAARLVTALDGYSGLFPPDSNLLGGAAPIEGVSTTAATAIWADFDTFSMTVDEALQAARAMQGAPDTTRYGAALSNLQQTCASCHETYVFYDPFAAIN